MAFSAGNFYFSSPPAACDMKLRAPPITISTNPSDVNILHLRDLFAYAGHSCHRFPRISRDGCAAAVDVTKLRTAVAHSSVVISAFSLPKFVAAGEGYVASRLDELIERALLPSLPSERVLVGFGRAVSDGGLTASIHDVVVLPCLQRLGIGKKIVQRIVRLLTNKGIYDISALCSEKERLFFQGCGFGNDSLGSTTMIYTRSADNFLEDHTNLIPAGRMLLLVPPSKEQYLQRSFSAKVDDLREPQMRILE